MKIAVCSLTYPLPNGVSSSVNESVDGLVGAGHEVVIVSPDYELGQARPEHRPVSSSAFGKALVRFFGKKERMFALKATGEIEEIMEEFSPDTYWLHTVTWNENSFEKVMMQSSAKKVLTYHTMLDVYGRMYLGKLGEQAMITRSTHVANAVDEVITPSQFMEGKLKSWGVTKPIKVIATGIVAPKISYSATELKRKFKIPEEAKLMVSVGRVVKEKNIEFLLQTTKRVLATEKNAHLLLIGPGDIEDTVERAGELLIADKITCSGQLPLEEAKACYAGADLFLFASQTETQGLVLGEAMIAHTPVVALRSPIQAEVYPESVSWVADTLPELAKNAVEVFKGGSEVKQKVYEAYKFVTKNFSKQLMLEKQLEVLSPAKVLK